MCIDSSDVPINKSKLPIILKMVNADVAIQFSNLIWHGTYKKELQNDKISYDLW